MSIKTLTMLLSCGHNEIRRGGLQALLACVLAWAGAARAQTDEIQVYDAGITAPGQFSLTWHNNFTAAGRRQAAFPSGVIPEHALNAGPEWAYGVTDWLEAGNQPPGFTPPPQWRPLVQCRQLPAPPVGAHGAGGTGLLG